VSKDGTIQSNTSINTLGGQYTLDGATLSIKSGAMTMMAGPEPLMKQEQDFVAALKRVTGFRAADGTLSLLAGGDVVLVFERAE
jgi:heat shock protein HslJ